MVARAHDRVRQTNDPTAHAVVVALREAARRLGTAQLGDVTVFATQEPCAMCVGALLDSDVTELVYAVPNRVDGAAGSVVQLAQHAALARRLQVVSGIRRAEAEELLDEAAALLPGPSRPDRDHRPSRLAQPPLLSSRAERCPSGLWCRSRKAVCESTAGSNPALSAIRPMASGARTLSST